MDIESQYYRLQISYHLYSSTQRAFFKIKCWNITGAHLPKWTPWFSLLRSYPWNINMAIFWLCTTAYTHDNAELENRNHDAPKWVSFNKDDVDSLNQSAREPSLDYHYKCSHVDKVKETFLCHSGDKSLEFRIHTEVQCNMKNKGTALKTVKRFIHKK